MIVSDRVMISGERHMSCTSSIWFHYIGEKADVLIAAQLGWNWVKKHCTFPLSKGFKPKRGVKY